MGVDCLIDIARVQNGLHLLDLGQDPVFRVTEPVAVIPLFPRRIGRIVNLLPQQIELILGLRIAAQDAFALGEVGGIAVVEQSWCQKTIPKTNWYPGTPYWKRWEMGYDDTPGCVPWEELLAAWNKITPGYWLVTFAHEHGADERDSLYTFSKPGVVLGDKVSWRLWT